MSSEGGFAPFLVGRLSRLEADDDMELLRTRDAARAAPSRLP